MIFTRDNLLINGDSLIGLQLLQGIQSYDFMLIDPPKRNLGEGVWEQRLKERLQLAYPLLKEDGAVAFFTNDQDYPFIRTICNEVFQEENYVNTFLLKKEHDIHIQKGSTKKLVQPFDFLVVYRKSERFFYKEGVKRKDGIMDTNMLSYPVEDEKGLEKYGLTDIKNVKTIKKILTMFTSPTSNILDFYAKSGSTGQAILELNYESKNSRTFTLITDNAEEICYPRIQKQSFIFNSLFDYLIIEDK